jgi:hypothetical protein
MKNSQNGGLTEWRRGKRGEETMHERTQRVLMTEVGEKREKNAHT